MILATITMRIRDMQCHSCEEKLQGRLKTVTGVHKVKASLAKGTLWVEYDPALCTPAAIEAAVREAGYSIGRNGASFTGIILIVAAIVLLGEYSTGADIDTMLSAQASYFMLFLIGLLTSLHCVGMCGGIMVSQTIGGGREDPSFRSVLLYHAGRLCSYTTAGFLAGALGSVIAVSLAFKAGITMAAGGFMLLMGLNLTGFRLSLPMPGKLRLLCAQRLKTQGAFTIGLLNGLMPCGPLQTMQLYALGTGSAAAGAAALLLFGLGTLPLMLPLGLAAGWLSKHHAGRILKLSGVLVAVLGIIMAGRGMAIAGIQPPWASGLSSQAVAQAPVAKAEIRDGVQVVRIAATEKGYTPNLLIVQKNLPVQWIIEGRQLNSCNNEIIVPALQLQQKLRTGETMIEFTPGDSDLRFSCWMGMIQGIIKVVDDLNTVDMAGIEPPPAAVSCCSGNGGGCCAKARPSIYGNDISKVSTAKFIHKAVLQEDLQTAAFRGIGAEFAPLVIIAAQHKPLQLEFDLSDFDAPADKFEIIEGATRTMPAAFIGRKGRVTVLVKAQPPGSYGIFKQGQLLGIIEVVTDLETADPEQVRAKLF